MSSRGSFLHLTVSEAMATIERIISATDIWSRKHSKLPREKKFSPEQKEEVLIAKLQTLQSRDSAVNPKPPIPHCKDDGLGFEFCKILVNQYKNTIASRRTLSQLPFPRSAHWNKNKDGMFSDVIEGEPSNFRNYSNSSPSMPTLDNLSQPIFQSILDPNDASYALPHVSHDDPRNSLRQPTHRIHEDHMDDEEMLRHWQKCVEWMDKEESLMESNLASVSNGEFLTPFDLDDEDYPSMEEPLDKTNPSDTQHTHEESISKIEDEDDINEQGIYYITTSSKPCSYETSPNSIGLSTS